MHSGLQIVDSAGLASHKLLRIAENKADKSLSV